MDCQKRKDISIKLKTAFREISSLSLEALLEKVEDMTQDQLNEYLKTSVQFYFSEDKTNILKRQKLEFKLFKIVSNIDITQSLNEVRTALETELKQEISYLRFKDKIGTIVISEGKLKSFENPKEIKVKIGEAEIHFEELDQKSKKEFSKNHGSHMEGILKTKYGKKTQYKIIGLLSHRRGIYLGTKKFRSVSDVKSIFKKLIKCGKIGEKIPEQDAVLMKELLQYHPKVQEKLSDFDHFELNFHPKYKDTKCFFVVRKDGEKVDFSYIRCIKEITALIK